MNAILPNPNDQSTDTLAKYVVLGIFIIVALVAIQYIFRNHIGMIEGLGNRNSKKGGSGTDPLEDENDGDIITSARKNSRRRPRSP
jgi:hypothetical protein